MPAEHSLFIAPAASEAWFNSAAEQLGNGGAALVMALSATGKEPATHGWCAVRLSPEKQEQVRALLEANPDKDVVWRPYSITEDPSFPDSVLQELGLKRVQFSR